MCYVNRYDRGAVLTSSLFFSLGAGTGKKNDRRSFGFLPRGSRCWAVAEYAADCHVMWRAIMFRD